MAKPALLSLWLVIWHDVVQQDLLRLKANGGWGTVSMVERYAHLLPTAYAAEAAA